MEILENIAPWIVLFLVFAIFLSLNIFYVKKLIENWREKKSASKINPSSLVPEQRKKIKADILSDLEKKLEAL